MQNKWYLGKRDILNSAICIILNNLCKQRTMQTGTQPKVDITINGYHSPLSTPSKATKDGVLLYIKENLIFKPQPDLHIYADKTIESHFAEIINPNGKNSVIGVIYRIQQATHLIS